MLGRVIKDRYRLDARLGAGGFSQVFEASDQREDRFVVVKTHDKGLENRHVELDLLYQREAITLCELHHENIVRVLDFGEEEGMYFLVMEHDHGISLHQYLTSCEWPGIPDVVRLMIQITSALQYVHKRGIIHQDLKPSNIILPHGRIDHCKIVDFGCALLHRLSYQHRTPVVMGTFPYISPEQLGAHAGVIDARSDLYSIGVMFYELLSGTRPYSSDTTPIDVKSGHFKKVAIPSLINPLVPAVLDRIVLKLINHHPDDRYQTADGLLEDLVHYQRLSRRAVGSPFFQIGRMDEKHDLALHIPFVGREKESQFLQDRLMRVTQGDGAFVLLAGQTGSGKTRLGEEFKSFAQTAGAIYLFGKCNEASLQFPYFPLIQVLQDYLEYVATLPDDEAAVHTEIARATLSPFAAELSNIAPTMAKYLDARVEATLEDPAVRLPQFLERIAQFFAALSQQTRPIIVIVEDIHWADPGTLQLLQILAGVVSKKTRVFALVSYRSEEVAERLPLQGFLKRIEGLNCGAETFPLSPLTPIKVWAFVSSVLPERTEGLRELVQMLFEFSRGNPLFILEMIRELIEEGSIVRHDGSWIINKDQLKFPVVGTTLAEIILARIKHLSPECKRLLNTASCIGRTFSRQLLFTLLLGQEEAIEGYLDEALHSRLIIKRSVIEGDEYAFTHDKVHETFYENLSPEHRQKLHLLIARTLEGQHTADQQKYVYGVAYHYMRGRDEAKACDYAIQAGMKAQRSLAMHQAAEFFEQALTLLERPGATRDQALELELRERFGDVCMIIGEYDKAIKNFTRVMAESTDRGHLAVLERKLGSIYLQRGDMPQSIQRFDAGLRHLRGGMAKTSLGSIITGGAHMLGYTLYSYIPLLRPLLSLSYRSRLQTMKELVNLYYQVSFTYFWVELARSFESTMKQRYIAGLLGKSRELALAYNETGIGWAVIAFAGAARRNIRRGKKLALRLNDHLALGNNLYFAGLIQQWTGHNPEAAQSFREAIEIHERIGALFELELEYTSLAQSLRHLGKLDQSCEFIMKLKEIAESVKDYRGIADAYYELAEYFYYNGNFEEARQNVALCFQYCNEASNPLLYSIGKRVLGKILLREGRLPQAIHELEESRRIASGRWLLGEYMLDTYISLGEAYLQQLQQDAAMPAERRKALCRDIEKMLRFCRLHAITSRNFVGPRYRLKAMYRQHIGQPKQAAACFEKAIATLSRQGQKYELARTFIHYAHFLQTTDKARADDLLAQAAALFRECNARGELADHAPVAEPAIGPARPVSPSPYPDHLQDMEKTVNLRERSPDVRGH